MKKIFKWIFRLLVLAVAMVALLILFRNPLLRIFTEQQIRQETGMEAILGRVRIDLRSPVVRLENVRLISPPEFGGRLFLDLPEVRLEYDSVAALFRRIRVRQLFFRLDEVRIVRNPAGRTNVDLLRERAARRRLAGRLAQGKWQFDGIDKVTFAVGRFSYLDAREPKKSEEVYAGAREMTLKPLRSGDELLDALARLAESRGAIWTAQALSPGAAHRAATVQSQ